MNYPMPRFDVLDPRGRPTGHTATIEEVYRQGLWHRSVQVLVYTPAGDILVQQRAPKSFMLPGFLDMSAAGGVDPGETPLQAAARETAEELGIEAPAERFEPLPVRRFNRDFPGRHAHSRAFIHAFLLRVPGRQTPLRLQHREVAAARFVPLAQAKRLVGQHRLPWGRLIPHFALYQDLIREVEARLG